MAQADPPDHCPGGSAAHVQPSTGRPPRPDGAPGLFRHKNSRDAVKTLQNARQKLGPGNARYAKKYKECVALLQQRGELTQLPSYLKPESLETPGSGSTPGSTPGSERAVLGPLDGNASRDTAAPRLTVHRRQTDQARFQESLQKHWAERWINDDSVPSQQRANDDILKLQNAVISIKTPARAAQALMSLLDRPLVAGLLRHYSEFHAQGYSAKQQEVLLQTAATCRENHAQYLSKKRDHDSSVAKHAVANVLVHSDIRLHKRSRTMNALFGLSLNIISKAAKRHVNLSHCDPKDVSWALVERSKRIDSMPEAWLEFAKEYWTEHTKPTANKRDVLKPPAAMRRQGITEPHQRHVLECSQEDLFRQFLQECDCKGRTDGPLFGVHMGYSMFALQKPWFVTKLRRSDRTTCACIHHLNIRALLQGLTSSREKMRKHLGSDVVAASNVSNSLSETAVAMLCPKEEGAQYFGMSCINGTCPECGPAQLLNVMPWEQSLETHYTHGNKTVPVAHAVFEYVEYVEVPIPGRIPVPGEAVPTRKKLTLVNKKMHPAHIVNVILQRNAAVDDNAEDEEASALAQATSVQSDVIRGNPYGLEQFIKHYHTHLWQADLYKKDVATFAKDTIILAVDFAENHSFLYKEEAQSLHWSPHQATIFVVILYRHHCAEVDGEIPLPDVGDPQDPDGGKSDVRNIVKEHLFFVSDDGTHDPFVIDHCSRKILNSYFRWPASAPGTSAAEASAPGTSSAEASAPGTSAAEASAPGTSAAEASAPGTSAAEASAPGTSSAEASAPGTSAAEASAPGTSAAEASAPGTSAAAASAPGTSAAEGSAPGTSSAAAPAPGTSAAGTSAAEGSEVLLPKPAKLKVWSDGAPTQLKNATFFSLMAQLSKDFGILIEHNYFCSNHGKGDHDGAGANVKHEASLHNLKSTASQQLKDAADFVSWGEEHFTGPKASVFVGRRQSITLARRRFILYGPDEVDHTPRFTVKTIPGTRRMHQVFYMPMFNGEALRFRPHGCVCEACSFGEYDACTCSSHVEEPEMRVIERRASSQVVTRLEFQRTGEDLADDLDLETEEGSHAMFLTSEPGWPYYIMVVKQGPHQLEADVKDSEGKVMYGKGEWVVSGHYYERFPKDVRPREWHDCKKRLYYLDTAALHYQYTHLVTVTHFSLPLYAARDEKVPCTRIRKAKCDVYEVPDDLHELLEKGAAGG